MAKPVDSSRVLELAMAITVLVASIPLFCYATPLLVHSLRSSSPPGGEWGEFFRLVGEIGTPFAALGILSSIAVIRDTPLSRFWLGLSLILWAVLGALFRQVALAPFVFGAAIYMFVRFAAARKAS